MLPDLIAGSVAISKLFVLVSARRAPTHPIFIPAFQLGIWRWQSQQLDGFAISSWAFYEEQCQVALVVEIIIKKLQIVASNQLRRCIATHKAANTCPHWPRGGRWMRTGNYRPCEAGQRAHQRIITPQASTSAQTLSRQTKTRNINNTKTKRAQTQN